MQAGGGSPTGPAAVWSKELAKLWLYSDFPHLGPSSSHAIWSRFAFDGVDCRVRTPPSPQPKYTRTCGARQGLSPHPPTCPRPVSWNRWTCLRTR